MNAFLDELVRWPSRYRLYWRQIASQLADGVAAGAGDSAEWDISGAPLGVVRASMRDTLEMRGCFHRGKPLQHANGAPAAPLIMLSYLRAGGVLTKFKKGMPESPAMRLGYRSQDGNVYSSKILLLDEVHNLVRQPPSEGSLSSSRPSRDFVRAAKDGVVVGLTGTPVVDRASDSKELEALLPGCIISAVLEPLPSYPKAVPDGAASGISQEMPSVVREVVLEGHAKEAYLRARDRLARAHVLQGYALFTAAVPL